MAVAASSSGSALDCEIAGTYQGKATATVSCPDLDITFDVKGGLGRQCNVSGKATYNDSERKAECTRMAFDAADGYTLEGRLDRGFERDNFVGFYGRQNCRVMRLRIFMDTGTCEVDMTKDQ
jgi:hypothetical protein